ncbi:MAG: response regulator [Verrucomicrobia bacterium]|jgi:PAS domain S-box-containing protein|nr:response regulator [Verrucomicrobiota bacterium]
MNPTDLKPNHRVLVIDDNPTIHADFRKILCPDNASDTTLRKMEAALFDEAQPAARTTSFQLDFAYQGQEGLEMVKRALAESRPYAMAFVDVRMPPGWDGVETIARIWEVYPELQIVVCTAYSDYSWEQLRAKVGQPDNLLVLKKPFDNVEVQQLTHALTKKWLLNLQAGLKQAELEAMVQRRTAELAQANESLTATEERFSKAFHASPIPSAIQTLPERRFVDVNEHLVTLTGCSREELIGRTSSDSFIWEEPALVDQWFERLARNEEVRDEATKVRNLSGALRDVLVSLVPVTLAGQPHALLLAQDISARLLLERQLRQAQKMEGVGQLAAGVAHDFNNILTVIQGHAGMTKNVLGEQNPCARSTEQILKATARAATLIRQLLMFSRKQVMQFRNIDLNESLANCLAMIEQLVGEHIQLDFRPGPELPAIHADSSMIEQVVMNLSVNARDAMPNGGRVAITTALVPVDRKATPMDPEDRHGKFVCLTFNDSGCGMDTQILGRIFEPFFTTKAVGKGTGLGLATVFGIVRQHQGWLEVESQPDHGTTFRLYFPASDQPAQKQETICDVTLRRGRETVLVAEDEEALREIVAEILRVQGYKVLTACSGRHALEVWEGSNHPVDLLVTDMVMPDGVMGGELAERLLARNPRLKVIYTSGYSPGMAGKDVSLVEGRNFLPKPYSIGKLAQFVRETLDKQVCTN